MLLYVEGVHVERHRTESLSFMRVQVSEMPIMSGPSEAV